MSKVIKHLKITLEYIWLLAALISLFIACRELIIHDINEALPFIGLFFAALFFFLMRRNRRKSME